MFSLTGKGINIARIHGGKYDKKTIKLITDKVDNDRDSVLFEGAEIVPMPSKDKEKRSVFYIAGMSGSGKSYLSGNIIKEYRRLFPKNNIFIFSRLDEDKLLDHSDTKRVILDDDFLENPININDTDELDNSLCIFDDIETIPEKKMRDMVYKLRDDLLICGRHKFITMIVTCHQICNYKETRLLLLEATHVAFFTTSGGTFHINRFLKEYAGLSKDQITKIYNLNSRWCLISKSFPMYAMYTNGCYIIK
jgi:hypothetical protein